MLLGFFRTSTLALLIPALLTLSACQSKTPEQLAAQSLETQKGLEFSAAISEVLRRNIMAANPQGLTGTVGLRIKLNRQNEVLGCEALPSTRGDLAADLVTPTLLHLARQVCWNTLFPAAAPEAFGNEDGIKAIADLQFPRFSQLPSRERQEYRLRSSLYQQSWFFWEQAVAGTGIDSIGVASFHYTANAQGQVQECLVNLERSEFRPEAFKADAALRQHLTQRCQQLDLRQMPDFVSQPNRLTRGEVLVEYMPWRGGPQPR
ncbi:hypothetical protein BLX41_12535 [Pseudomonas protegens]|uniref:hypothetical protein n=1 Tax=Pseudomonas protegens TaxID=380021 RepID=UPI000F4CCACE|nr:hypothetical protein [Pseudomonas protegens]ROL77623.1 hypothetical protein BLX41_12535 [Pseudomonas protegens]